MANEITVNLKLSATKTYLKIREDPGPITVDLASAVSSGGVQSIGTAAEAIAVGDVTSAGYAYFRNVSTANYIELGTGTGTSFAAFSKLKYGEAGIIRLGTNAPTAKANTAAGELQYWILSD